MARRASGRDQEGQLTKKVWALALAGVALLGACGDDKEGNAAELKKFCETSGGAEDACTCYAEDVADEFSTDELQEMIDDQTLGSDTASFLEDCMARGTSDDEAEE
jgi:hypothetical protein